jgi:hypothetical protein
VPDYGNIAPTLEKDAPGRWAVTAFAHTMECFPDAMAHKAGAKFALHGFASGTVLKMPKPEEGLLSGEIISCEKLTNPETGQEFVWILLNFRNELIDVVGDPLTIRDDPVVGGTLELTGWFSARLIPEPD